MVITDYKLNAMSQVSQRDQHHILTYEKLKTIICLIQYTDRRKYIRAKRNAAVVELIAGLCKVIERSIARQNIALTANNLQQLNKNSIPYNALMDSLNQQLPNVTLQATLKRSYTYSVLLNPKTSNQQLPDIKYDKYYSRLHKLQYRRRSTSCALVPGKVTVIVVGAPTSYLRWGSRQILRRTSKAKTKLLTIEINGLSLAGKKLKHNNIILQLNNARCSTNMENKLINCNIILICLIYYL